MDKKDLYFIVGSLLLVSFSVALALLSVSASTLQFLQTVSNNINALFLFSALLITVLTLPLVYFGYKSKFKLIKYASILLLILTFASWISIFAVLFAAITAITYMIIAIIFSKHNKNNKPLLYSELILGVIGLFAMLPFLVFLIGIFSLPPCYLHMPGSCNPGFNMFDGVLVIPISVFGTLAVVLIKQGATPFYSALKRYYLIYKERKKAKPIVATIQSEKEFAYVPLEIKIGLLIAFFFAIVAGILILGLLLFLLFDITIISILSLLLGIRTGYGFLLSILLSLLLLFFVYILIRIGWMWGAANSGDIKRLKRLNSIGWAIVAIITVIFAPVGVILLIMHSPIDNIKRGLSVADLNRLIKLKKLYDGKVITKEEYEIERKRILGGYKTH